ncbi:MAG: hypothetical protein WDN04_27470 [Rhodospirillales bacterium]
MDVYPTAPLLDPARLDLVALRVWTKSTRTDLDGRQFWARVTHYVDFIEGEPRIGQFALVLSHTGADMMAFFLALIACGRLAAFFSAEFAAAGRDVTISASRSNRSARSILPPSAFLSLIWRRRSGGSIPRSATVWSRCRARRTRRCRRRRTAGDGDAARAPCVRPADLYPAQFRHHGHQKAVGISGQSLTRQYAAYWPLIRQQAGTDHLRLASWAAAVSRYGLIATFLLPMLGGDTISIIDPFEWINTPGALLDMIETDGADVCWLPNFAFRHFSRLRKALPHRNLADVRLWINCSEPCRYADAVRFEQDFAAFGVRPGSVVGCYAMAETVFAVSQLVPGEAAGAGGAARNYRGHRYGGVGRADRQRRHAGGGGLQAGAVLGADAARVGCAGAGRRPGSAGRNLWGNNHPR